MTVCVCVCLCFVRACRKNGGGSKIYSSAFLLFLRHYLSSLKPGTIPSIPRLKENAGRVSLSVWS